MKVMDANRTLTFDGATAQSHARPRQETLFDKAELVRKLVAAEPHSEAARLALALVDDIEHMAREAEAVATRRVNTAVQRVAGLQAELEAHRRELRDLQADRAQLLGEREGARERLAAHTARIADLEHHLRSLRHGHRPSGPAIPDRAEGPGLRPDPSAATTQAQLMACLRAYREWSGNRSIRQIAAGSGGRVSPTQVHLLLRETQTQMPVRLDQLAGIIRGCGGSDEDLRAWATAWRTLRATAAAG